MQDVRVVLACQAQDIQEEWKTDFKTEPWILKIYIFCLEMEIDNLVKSIYFNDTLFLLILKKFSYTYKAGNIKETSVHNW